ncbi:MAG: transporter [Proteobacteria bacterium]|nr:transporter [Pseudomonadota bacterium]
MIAKFAAAMALGALATPALADNFVPSRPGNTESPISSPTGRWQVETEIGSYSVGHGDDRSWSALQTNFRYGLAPGWDAQIIASPFVGEEVGGDRAQGFGDTTLRLHHNLIGEDGNGPAFALIGFVTLPTGTNGQSDGAVEGGVIGTGSFAVTGADGITYTAGAAAVSVSHEYKSDVFGGVNLTHQFTDAFSAYAELFADRSQGQTATTFDIGGAFLSDARTQWDAGVDIGLTDAADNARFFVGWAHLF